jgi:hypothetical protein
MASGARDFENLKKFLCELCAIFAISAVKVFEQSVTAKVAEIELSRAVGPASRELRLLAATITL